MSILGNSGFSSYIYIHLYWYNIWSTCSAKVGWRTEEEDEYSSGESTLLDRETEAELGDYKGEGGADVSNIRQSYHYK